jgi:hypothetical protein
MKSVQINDVPFFLFFAARSKLLSAYGILLAAFCLFSKGRYTHRKVGCAVIHFSSASVSSEIIFGTGY